MAKEPLLAIFVDALPLNSQDKLIEYMSDLNYAPMQPSFGFSINLKAELFAKLHPDNVGYFNEWSYDPQSTYKKKKKVLQYLFSAIAKIHPLVDGMLHKIFNRINDENIFRIPFKFLQFFSKNATEAYKDDFPHPTVFSKGNITKFLYCDYSGADRDEQAIAALHSELQNPKSTKYFLALCEVDHQTHIVGVDNDQHDILIKKYAYELSELKKRFLNKFPSGNFIVFSDHGMANTKEYIDFDLEKEVGNSSSNKYIYFKDATFIRVWTFSEEYKKAITTYFNRSKFGHILTAEERTLHNITDKKFGDIIFVVNEGVLIVPSFFGRHIVKGMHGYLPQYASQTGIVAANFPLKDRYQTFDVFTLLENLINE